jgi:hypothetical protein
VKACFASVDRNSSGYDHIILDDLSISSYLNLPKHIVEKYESGLINKTHFSEIIRCTLLSEYGGVWLDSTVFLSDQIGEQFKSKSQYLFVKVPSSDIFGPKEILFDTWVLSSPKQSEYFDKLKNFFYNYWLKENKQIDYFLCHLAMKHIFESSLTPEERAIIYGASHSLNYIDCHELQTSLTTEFSIAKLDFMLSRSTVHKLTFYFHEKATRPFPGEDFLHWVLGEADDLSSELPLR